MLKNYFKTAFRHLWKDQLYSFINLAGLAVAFTAVILSILYFKDERGFDLFHKNNPYLYRINTTYIDNKTGQKEYSGGTGQVQGPAFKAQLPEIMAYSRIWGGDIMENVKYGNKGFNLGTAFVDSGFFNVFSFPLLYGNPATALVDKHSAVITESTAKKFFGSTDVVGKRLEMADNPDSLFASFTITGVTKDPPINSSIQFDILIPFSYLQIMFDDNSWLNAYLGTYVVLHPQTNLKTLEQKFNAIHQSNAGEQLEKAKRTGEFNKQTTYSLQPVTDIHLNPLYSSSTSHEGGSANGSNPWYSYFLLGISLFILLMASINFINLSIANSLKRAKEIGIRKITGGSKTQIIWQFLIESSLICCMAFLLAILLTQNALPLFNKLSGKQLSFAVLADGSLFFSLLCLLVVNVLLAGFYPAFVLAKFKPTEVLYNKQKLSGNSWLGKGLVIFQFSLAACLIVASLIYYRQMDFMRTKDLGYNPANIIRVEIPPRRDTKTIYTQFKNELSREVGISQLSLEANMDGGYKMGVNDKTIKGNFRLVEESYLPMLEIPLKEGRNFSPLYGTDKTDAAIVNESFVKAAGIKNPIGTQIHTNDWFVKNTLTIIGVVKDYHHGSLKEAIQPMVLAMGDQSQGTMLVKIDKAKYKQSLAALEKIYKSAIPGSPFSYVFWNELNAKEYEQEVKWQNIINVATGLSVFICCIGLFGLTNLATQRRVKEIGIRKVLGASAAGIAALLTVDFLKLVLTGFVIASPVAWWVMHRWLQDFAYRIHIGWQLFFLSGGLILAIALLTVSFRAVKAALANPVKSLRTE